MYDWPMTPPSQPERQAAIVYPFPEPLPMLRARGIQCANTVVALARLGTEIDLYYVPGPAHPIRAYGLVPPQSLRLAPLSRSLPWPLGRFHSNRAFLARLLRAIAPRVGRSIVLVRHLKLAALLLERLPTVRLVYEAHEVFADTAPAAKAKRRREEESLVVRKAAAIVANSAATAARLIALYGAARKLEVIPNGVSRPDALPAKDWLHAGRHIVYAGSLFPWKGAAELVAAGRRLPGCRIELIGGDPESVRRLASAGDAAGAELAFAGQLPHEETQARLARSCIAVLPNRADPDSAFTSPIKLFEYMAAGCAIVASDLPSVREILDEDEALWTRAGDAESLAKAIATLAADPARAQQLGARVREKSSRFTWQERARRLKRLLESIEQRRP